MGVWGESGGDFLDIESRAGPQNSRTKKPPCYAPKIFSSIKMLATNRKKVFFTVRSGKKGFFISKTTNFRRFLGIFVWEKYLRVQNDLGGYICERELTDNQSSCRCE